MDIKAVYKYLTTADKCLILLLLFLCAASLFFFSQNRSTPNVEIYLNNHLIASYPLNIDRTVTISKHNRIEIANCKVRMSYSDCKHQLCVKQGWSSELPIICIPNKIIVRFANKQQKLPHLITN